MLFNYANNFWHKSKSSISDICYAKMHVACVGRIHFYDTKLRNEDREVRCRICHPVGTFICHIDDLDVSDSFTVARRSLGPWHSPLASGVL